jgi:hypothetical protein
MLISTFAGPNAAPWLGFFRLHRPIARTADAQCVARVICNFLTFRILCGARNKAAPSDRHLVKRKLAERGRICGH